MSIRAIVITKGNIYNINAYYARTSFDMYMELYVNGEEITLAEIVNTMYPYWRAKGNKQLMDKRHNASRDPYIEFKYINYLLNKEIHKIRDMKEIWKYFLQLFQQENR